MRNRTFLALALIHLIGLLAACNTARAQKKYSFQRPAMGSPFTITIATVDSLKAAQAADAAFRLADTLNGILSDYIDSSEINRLSATSGQNKYIKVSQPLFDILSRAQEAARLTNGSYDITIGPVVKLWRKARKTGVAPTKADITAALRHTGYRYLHLDTANQAVWLEISGMQLDVGGLGKGFVAQAALQRLAEAGFPIAMVNAGGKIVTGQPPLTSLASPSTNQPPLASLASPSANQPPLASLTSPSASQLPSTGQPPSSQPENPPSVQPGWLIGINAPGEKDRLLPILLSLHNMSVATSGDIYQYLEWKGKRYSHIIDPHTGIGLTRRRNVTAIARDGTTADWLATACSILSYHRSLKLLKHFPGAALLVAEMKHGRIIRKSSHNFSQYQLPDAPANPKTLF